MSQTRLDLDAKLSALEARAREMTPRRYVKRHVPERFLDRLIGGVLTVTGATMAWRRFRENHRRRQRVRAAMASYGRW